MGEPTLAELLARLTPDERRSDTGFSPELESANETLWSDQPIGHKEETLRTWLSKHQPCLFGRVAAKRDAITFCIITEADILGHDDKWIQEYIQRSRLRWYHRGFEGQSSSFIIAIISRAVANALPDEASLDFAKRLCAHYLLREPIETDKAYLDEIFLRSRPDLMWKWLAGINYFSAAADGRWWQDHRFPGGMAFSINSVGHLVKSATMLRADRQYRKSMEVENIDDEATYVNSLPEALVWAMRTIEMAQDGVDGRATCLMHASGNTPAPLPGLPEHLRGFEHRCYLGYYHTDHTLPSVYFRDDLARPAQPMTLDFTYLFDDKIGNPDHVTMGAGRRIAAAGNDDDQARLATVVPQEVPVQSSSRLLYALQFNDPVTEEE